MCKLKFKILKDSNISNNNDLLFSNNMQQSDENMYFIDAKKIRVSFKSNPSSPLEKKEVNVHVDCLKQMERIKAEKALRKTDQNIDDI